MKKHLATIAVSLAVLALYFVAFGGAAVFAGDDNYNAPNTAAGVMGLGSRIDWVKNGRPTFRVRVWVDAGIATDTSINFDPARDGGALDGGVTFTGGEYLCAQAQSAFCMEVGPLSGYTAYCARAVDVAANSEYCWFMRSDDTKVTFDARSNSADIRVYEKRYNR